MIRFTVAMDLPVALTSSCCLMLGFCATRSKTASSSSEQFKVSNLYFETLGLILLEVLLSAKSMCTSFLAQIFRLEGRIPLIVVAVVDAFHVDLAAIDLVGQSRFQQNLDLHVLDGAALHGQ